MDLLQDYAGTAYGFYLEAEPYLRPVRAGFNQLKAMAYPTLVPVLDKVATLAQDSPAIVSVGVLLLFLLVAMRILDMARRILMFWMKVVTWITFWGGIVLLAAAIWQRGVGRTAEDFFAWGEELYEVWWREYRKWEGYQNQGRNTGKTNIR